MWIVPIENLNEAYNIADKYDFDIIEIEIESDFFVPSQDKLREERQGKINRKAERLRKQSESKFKQAQKIEDSIPDYQKDFQYLTQPILVGHHSEKRHRKQREQLSKKMDDKGKLLTEAFKLKEHADLLSRKKARVKGDAEKEWQKKRDENDKVISKGSRVNDFAFGNGTVVRVNKDTYTIQFDRGPKYPRDKSYVKKI